MVPRRTLTLIAVVSGGAIAEAAECLTTNKLRLETRKIFRDEEGECWNED
jgi:hypothetical protein